MKQPNEMTNTEYIGFFCTPLTKAGLVEMASRRGESVSACARAAISFGLLVLARQWQRDQQRLEAEIGNAINAGTAPMAS